MNNHIDNYIDCCINSEGSHYDVSVVTFEILKDNYKYDTDNIWKYKNNEDWVIDDKNTRLKLDIKTTIVNTFLSRSQYWSDNKPPDNNPNIICDNELKSLKLLKISNKIRDDKFISQLIKEIKQFY